MGAEVLIHIVTCRPTVGLRIRTLLGSRPVNTSRSNTRYATIEEVVFSPCRAVSSRTVIRVPTQHAAMTSHGTGVGEYHVTFAFPRVTQHTPHLARCCDTDRATGNSNARTIEGYISGTEMSKKSVFMKQLYESVVK
jgi:hypothetical protein